MLLGRSRCAASSSAAAAAAQSQRIGARMPRSPDGPQPDGQSITAVASAAARRRRTKGRRRRTMADGKPADVQAAPGAAAASTPSKAASRVNVVVVITAVIAALLAAAFGSSAVAGRSHVPAAKSAAADASGGAQLPSHHVAVDAPSASETVVVDESVAEEDGDAVAVDAEAVSAVAAGSTEAQGERAAATAEATAACEDRADASVGPEGMAMCPYWAGIGECAKNPEYMRAECAKSCDVCATEPQCRDRDTSGACHAWAAAGECEANPSFMKLRCAKSCNTCDWLDYKKRCPMVCAPRRHRTHAAARAHAPRSRRVQKRLSRASYARGLAPCACDARAAAAQPADRVPAVGAGAMQRTFERALNGSFAHLEPSVLSRDPWVVSFDRFLADAEVDALLRHGEGRYERSTASGGRKDDEFVPLTSDIRTSWTTWCDNATCTDDPHVRAIYERVSDVTQVRAAARARRTP